MDTNPSRIQKVSVHGGHSGQFCQHASDRLEDIVQRYIDGGFTWVGLSEHMPPPQDSDRYPDEVAAGLTAADLTRRFADYVATAHRLKARYADRITLYVGMETEAYPGAIAWIKKLTATYPVEYLVGSVHHAGGGPLDYTAELYHRTARKLGGITALYAAYFKCQYELLAAVNPRVVGHFDLVRIFDNQYRTRLADPEVMRLIEKNLQLIKQRGMILDLNLRPFYRGEKEPYPAKPVIKKAVEMGIDIVPGEDSHGAGDVGRFWDKGLAWLQAAGGTTDWPDLLQPFGGQTRPGVKIR